MSIIQYDILSDKSDLMLMFRDNVVLKGAKIHVFPDGEMKLVYVDGSVAFLARCSDENFDRIAGMDSLVCTLIAGNPLADHQDFLVEVVRMSLDVL